MKRVFALEGFRETLVTIDVYAGVKVIIQLKYFGLVDPVELLDLVFSHRCRFAELRIDVFKEKFLPNWILIEPIGWLLKFIFAKEVNVDRFILQLEPSQRHVKCIHWLDNYRLNPHFVSLIEFILNQILLCGNVLV